MRVCDRCGHSNADHLSYCFSCGRRVGARQTATNPLPAPSTSRDVASAISTGSLAGPSSRDGDATGFAATVALSNLTPSAPGGSAPRPRRIGVGALDALEYLFAYVRGRIDSEERKRSLGDEREGARRLLEGALAELGATLLDDSTKARAENPALGPAMEAVARADAKRRGAVADIMAAEKFLAAEESRLAAEQASAETEWKACDSGAQGVDKLLRQVEDDRRLAEGDISRLRDPSAGRADLEGRGSERAVLEEKRGHLDEQYASLRERAAALRAATVGARAKVDHVIAARRQGAATMAATLVGHTRERADAERQVRELTIQVGRLACASRSSLPALSPAYGRIDRLETTIAERERQIAAVASSMGHYDSRRLAAGIGVLTALLGVVIASLWVVLR